MQNSHIVDCDGHLVEPPDLWERYLDGGLRAKAPRLVTPTATSGSRWRAGSTRSRRATAKSFPGLPTA